MPICDVLSTARTATASRGATPRPRVPAGLLLSISELGRQVKENRSHGTGLGDAGGLFVAGGRAQSELLGEPADLGRRHGEDPLGSPPRRGDGVYAAHTTAAAVTATPTAPAPVQGTTRGA